jgi:hypothetical protein
LFAFQPQSSTIPSNYPLWASWESQEVYLPAEFHSTSAFKKALLIGLEALKECVLLQNGRIDAPLLLLWLMYWEASRAIEVEPELYTPSPSPRGMLGFHVESELSSSSVLAVRAQSELSRSKSCS